MFSFTDPKQIPHVFAYCECKRQYIIEEMYGCFNCSIGFCRFCCIEEIQSYFCKNCSANQPASNELATGQDVCSRCAECPNCRSNLNIMASPNPNNPNSFLFFYQCNYCFWDSRNIGICEEQLEKLLGILPKRYKDNLEPIQTEYNRNLATFKESQLQKETNTMAFQKFKKRFESYLKGQSLIPKLGGTSVKKHWTVKDATDAEIEKDKKLLTQITVLKTDETITLKLTGSELAEQNPIVEKSILKDLYDTSFPSLDEELSRTKDLNRECSMQQRMNYPLLLNPTPKDLYPRGVKLIPKRLRKCKKCQKRIVQPNDASVVSSSFKLITTLAEYFPKIIIKSITGLKRGFDCNVELEFYNRTKYTLNIVISEIDPEITKTLDIQKYEILANSEFVLASDWAIQETGTVSSMKIGFKVPINSTSAPKLIRFGFLVTSSIEIDSNKISLKMPIVVGLGVPES